MTEEPPLVTVIVPSYDYAEVLPHCLQALKEQTYSPLEIVVVDDCSTDGSAQIAESMGVNVVRTPANGGAAVARSVGAAWAKGPLLFFVDADVALAPDAVANAVALLAADPGLGAVCGVYDPEPLLRPTRVQYYRALQTHYWTISSLGESSFLWSNAFGMRAEVFAEIGPFNPRLRYNEEVDYGHRINQRYTVLTTAEIRGRGDHDEFRTLLRKLFHRTRYRVPLYARSRRFARSYETPSRVGSALAVGSAAALLPLPVLLGLPWAAVPAGLLAVSLACDARMYRFVVRRRGAAFAAFFVGMHLLVNLVVASAVATGCLQWLVSRGFRHYYDPEPAAARPDPTHAGPAQAGPAQAGPAQAGNSAGAPAR